MKWSNSAIEISHSPASSHQEDGERGHGVGRVAQVNSFLTIDDFCRLLMTLANDLDQYQDR